MDWNAARLVFEVVAFALSCGAWVFLFYLKRQSANRDDLDRLSVLVTRHDERLANVPTKEEISELRVGLAKVHGAVDTLAAEVHGVRDLLPPLQNGLNMITDWILKNK